MEHHASHSPARRTDDGEITEAVTKMTWTADANSRSNRASSRSSRSRWGPLPKVDQDIFKALQTYSDGDVVRWIDRLAPFGPVHGWLVEHAT
jgi:hypothetical protein